jgi:eukaryotic-like serine/threonine-protein kinase
MGMSFELGGSARFEIRRQLGEGGMGIVYEAWDREREAAVALKTLRSSEPHLITRLKREFRALADVQHANLVRLGELFSVDGHWFFTMELLERAQDIVTFVRGGARRLIEDVSPSADTLDAHERLAAKTVMRGPVRLDESRLRSCLRQVALGLYTLHEAGKVHRDLKPSNILVVPDGRTVVVDFGLVADLVGERSSEANIVGTPMYMAPEQAASQQPGPAADWYALGTILYEAVTDAFPYDGDPLAVLMAKQTSDPDPPRLRNPDVPRDLDDLCMELLRRDPRVRPQGRQILERLGAPAASIPRSRARSSPSETPFVGRGEYIAQLDDALRDVAAGTTVFAAIVGESGIGKSALARRFFQAQREASTRALVLAGRCYERETVSYKAFDGIVDALVTWIEALDPFDSASLLPADAALLVRMFPALRRLPAFARAVMPHGVPPSAHDQRGRAFRAFRELIARLGDRAALIVFIDDLQWADPDSLQLLEELLRAPQPPRCLVLATLRSGETAESLLPRIENVVETTRRVMIRPLEQEESAELARKLMRGLDATSAARIDEVIQEANGHPLFLHELVREIAAGTTSAGVDNRAAAVRLDEVLRQRVGRMEPAARRLLEIVAVAGAPIAQHIAARAAALSRDEAVGQFIALRTTNLVRTDGARAKDSVTAYHDRVREAVLAGLDEATLRSHHAGLADALAHEGPSTSPHRLIAHLVAAGEVERAAETAAIAARLADDALAFDQAAELYALSLRLREPGEPRRLELLLALGNALGNAGRGPEAADALLGAASLGTGLVRLDALQRAAEHLLGSGHIERGRATLDEVLAAIGERLPLTRAGVVWSIAWHRLRVRLRDYRWTPRSESEVSPAELTRIHIYGAVAIGLGHVDTVRAIDYQARGLVRALRLGEPKRVCRALAREAGFLATAGHRRADDVFRVLDKARALARELQDRSLEAFCKAAEGIALTCLGRFRQVPSINADAERMVLETGATWPWELNLARFFHMRALKFLGRAPELEMCAHEYLRDAQRRGDLYTTTTVTRGFNITWLVRDDVTTARRELQCTWWTPPETSYHIQHIYLANALLELALYESSAAKQFDEHREAVARFHHSQFTRIQLTRCEVNWLHGRLAVAAAAASPTPGAFLDEAATAAKRLLKENVEYASAWGMLVRAAIHSQRGEHELALAALRDTARRADAEELQLVAAAARLREGRLIGGDEGRSLEQDGLARMQALGVKAPDRMAEVIAPGFRRTSGS